ncbi:MAG: flagellar motor switch protein FliG [Candidatus Marinimicrobia bacterium]|jgi:flagellar motor switch protein FliG|nr:flagellar motor switch protein FliG [Candidatus Neomarinimicrobiota bacterium]
MIEPYTLTSDNLNSTQKAAMLLITMGVDNAAQVMKNMSDSEVEKISFEIAKLRDIPSEVLGQVIQEFYEVMIANETLAQGGFEYAKDLLEHAWGDKKSDDVIKRLEIATGISAFSLLGKVDNKRLLDFLGKEHPQTAALILSNLRVDQASSLLAELPEENRIEISYRLATLQDINPELIEDVEAVLRDQIGAEIADGDARKSGVESTADLLNAIGQTDQKVILDGLKKIDEELCDDISSYLFMFDDIVTLTDNAIQAINGAVDNKILAPALKGAKDDLRERFYKNMSERAGGMLRDEIDVLPPMPMKDIEKAQSDVLLAVFDLESKGELSISRSGEEQDLI